MTEATTTLTRADVYDANERESYLAGHIPGAKWVKYDAVTAAILPPSKDARLVFYCYNPICGAAPHAARDARALGYRNVWVMPDGISGWRSAGMAVVAGPNPK
jgi:rhodanese-related sulfurtransferase